MVLEKDGEELLLLIRARSQGHGCTTAIRLFVHPEKNSCSDRVKKSRSITGSRRRGMSYKTIKRRNAKYIWSHLALNLPL
jgi:hypothetical protein